MLQMMQSTHLRLHYEPPNYSNWPVATVNPNNKHHFYDLRVWSNLYALILKYRSVMTTISRVNSNLSDIYNAADQRNLHTPNLDSIWIWFLQLISSTCLELGLKLPHRIGQPGEKLIIHTQSKIPALAFDPNLRKRSCLAVLPWTIWL